jgi:hypothetical protein
MTLLEAILNKKQYYKTDRNYVFTIDKPSKTKSAVAGGIMGGAVGAAGAKLGEWGGAKAGEKLLEKAATHTGTKKRALELLSKAAHGGSRFATKAGGRAIAAGIILPVGALIGHVTAKRKLKYADPYVQGILDKVKGQEIKRKQYKNLLKGQEAISVRAHRLFPRGGG